MTTVPDASARIELAHRQVRYNETAATTNEAMCGLLAACAGLDFETRNNIVRAAIAYAEVDHIRRAMAKEIMNLKRKHGIR